MYMEWLYMYREWIYMYMEWLYMYMEWLYMYMLYMYMEWIYVHGVDMCTYIHVCLFTFFFQINATALYWASQCGDHNIVQKLLQANADVNIALMPSVSDIAVML